MEKAFFTRHAQDDADWLLYEKPASGKLAVIQV